MNVAARTGVFERHVWCAFEGKVSEAREEGTFLANDTAYLALPGAVTQPRRSETVTLGVGLTVCGGVWCSKEKWVSTELSPSLPH